ncbi:Saf4/Yju2 family protein [Aspergillus mulundensis]|uniref:Uncharacterized protein n=1 Tax=Aspergillus mulundensis TaxID=1810919 RepID=A0A3D8T5D8_9EURO|nr:hypothetical protein DSM5745_01099 [Aspergillus mulundensis]RDW93777.1 hypothetical protein DSM5745_01099 [Aspergillus mulundensis]
MQGFNMGRYIPPDQEGLTTANKLANKHPLGSRARHLHTKGALIVRFEMPFAVWCTTCKPENIIGQGVRFNAEKKKVGNYYSTPIYSFRMKHTVCGGWIEIRTDPKNTAIEGKVEDKRVVDQARARILELQERQQRDWEDPYEVSRRLRRGFRAERKGIEREEAVKESLKDKMSLGIEIVDEVEEDAVRAGMVDFDEAPVASMRTRPMFETASSSRPGGVDDKKSGGAGGKRKTADLVAERKALFRSELAGNTRAVVDPFLNGSGNNANVWEPEVKKRKGDGKKVKQGTTRDTEAPAESTEREIREPEGREELPDSKQPASQAPGLVDYGSDTE